MGNIPSKEPQGRSFHRLSKPKVASQPRAPTTLLNANGHLKTSNRSSDPGPDLFSIPYSTTAISSLSIDIHRDDVDDTEKRNSFLAPSRPQRRRSLFRSKSSQETAERRRSRRNTVIGSPSLPLEASAVARTNSLHASHLGSESNAYGSLSSPDNYSPDGLRASWAYNLSSYEAQRILSFLPEQQSGLSRNNSSSLLYEPKPDAMRRPARRRDSLPVQPVSAPIGRSNSEMTLHPPMRRRSIVQTPGVATRSVRPGPITTKTSYRHSLPATPSISRQASFEDAESRVISLPPLPPIPASFRAAGNVPRVVTPVEGDYSTTGVFKLGTLRITNGSPDLTPDVPGPHGSQQDGSEPHVAGTDYFTKLPPRKEEGTSHMKPHRTLVYAHSAATEKSNEENRFPKNLVPETRADANPPTLSVVVPSSKIEIGSLAGFISTSGDSTNVAAGSSVLETQSKHTAAEDQLFEAEDESEADLPTTEVLDVRVDLSARRVPSQRRDDELQPGAQAIERSDSGFVSNAVSDSSNSHSSLTKADSGYSSSVSLRSFRSGRMPAAVDKDVGQVSTERARQTADVHSQDSSQVIGHTIPTVNGDSSGDERAPTPPPKDVAFVKQAEIAAPEDCHANPTSSGKSRGKRVRQQLPAINTSRTEGRNTKKSEFVPPTPASTKSDASESASSLSIASKSQKHGRLHRFLSLRGSNHLKAPLTVHVTHAVDEQVPSIPKDIEDKLRDHAGRFPLSAKRLALKSQLSQETLKTILSVGSLEFAKENELPHTTTFFGDRGDGVKDVVSGDAKENSIRQTITSMQSNFKQAAVLMMSSKKPTALKAVSTRKEAPQPRSIYETAVNSMLAGEADFTSYVSASTGLGSNSYLDTKATTDFETHPRRSSGRSMTMTPAQESHQPLRTYSLCTMPSTGLTPLSVPVSPSSPDSRASSPSKRIKSPPPVSMTTRSSRRPPPPPRSALRPRVSDVRQENGHEFFRNPHSDAAPAPQIPPLNPQRSLDSVRRAVSFSSTLQYRTAEWVPHAHQNSCGSRNTSLDSSRHNSFSSIQSDLPYSQHHVIKPGLKRQSSNDGFSQNKLQAAYVSQVAQRGPQSTFASWNTPQGRYQPPSVQRGQRGHYRNMSTGSGPRQATDGPPYRILHSYNSPAYRNAPIWG